MFYTVNCNYKNDVINTSYAFMMEGSRLMNGMNMKVRNGMTTISATSHVNIIVPKQYTSAVPPRIRMADMEDACILRAMGTIPILFPPIKTSFTVFCFGPVHP